MKVLVVGRSGSGKDTVKELLERTYNFKFVKSYTTRSKRYPLEDTHVFISRAEAKEVKNKAAVTYINNGKTWDEYFSTIDQFESCNGYIVDPIGVYQVLASFPDEEFIIVYMYVGSLLKRLFHCWIRNKSQILHPYRLFDRFDREDSEFTQFELLLQNAQNFNNLFALTNVKGVVTFVNNYDGVDSLKEFAEVVNTVYLASSKKS